MLLVEGCLGNGALVVMVGGWQPRGALRHELQTGAERCVTVLTAKDRTVPASSLSLEHCPSRSSGAI